MSGQGKDARPATAAPVEEDPNAGVVCSSPPCFLHELDPSYLGYLRREEVSALLGRLLAADWGGAVPDEEGLRAALRRQLAAHGGPAARVAEPACRGLERLPQAVEEALPRVHDDALRRDLGRLLGALRGGS